MGALFDRLIAEAIVIPASAGDGPGIELLLLGEPPPIAAALWQIGPIIGSLAIAGWRSGRFNFASTRAGEAAAYLQIATIIHFIIYVMLDSAAWRNFPFPLHLVLYLLLSAATIFFRAIGLGGYLVLFFSSAASAIYLCGLLGCVHLVLLPLYPFFYLLMVFR